MKKGFSFVLGVVLVFVVLTCFSNIGMAGDSTSVNVQNDSAGFKLVKIEPGSTYQKLGLREGDVITEINGKKIDSVEAANSIFSDKKAGQKFKVVILRNGKILINHYTIK